MRRSSTTAPEPASSTERLDAGALLALAYADRVAMARRNERGRYLLRNASEVAIDPASSLAGEAFLVVAELDGKRPTSRAFLAAPIDEEAVGRLFADQIVVSRGVSWRESDAAVVAREQRHLGALVLAERDVRADPHDVALALMSALIDGGALDEIDLRAEVARVEFARRVRPGDWPDLSVDGLRATAERWLAPRLTGMRSLSDARRVSWGEAVLSLLDYRQRAQLDALAPTHLAVPTGSRLRIDYTDPSAPAVEVRIQEMFGLRDTPRIGDGAVPITLRLLSPANRPVQVTRDLAGFWKNSYFDVRKDLRGRYPKHAWPDDPSTAIPTRKTKRR